MRDSILTRDEVRALAPSVFATSEKSGLSDKYQQYPTSKVLDLMDGEGWKPVRAQEQRVLNPERKGFQKHLLRFRHVKDIMDIKDGRAEIGREFFEIVLTNSHDGTSSYKLSAGIFRLVCLNGAVVGNQQYSMSIRHMGNDPREVLNASMKIAENAPAVMRLVQSMKETMLNPDEKNALAKASYLLKWDDIVKEEDYEDANGKTRTRRNTVFNPAELLRTNRIYDQKDDLWTTYNTIQENIMKGRKNVWTADRKLKNLRGVKGINEDIRLNKSLWSLSEEMLKIKGGIK